MDRSVSSHCGRGRPASWAALVVCLALAESVASPPGASAAALAGAWGARVGSGGANGTATLRVLADATGSLALALAKLQPSASLTVRIHKGTCASVGPVVASLPSIRTTPAGAASRTSGLTASQARAVGAATAGTGRIALRVGSGSSVRCGAFTVIPPDVAVAVSGATEPMSTGTTRTFTAAVTGTSETRVTWSVVEKGGGSITQDGVYTAPALPGTYTVRATSTVDVRASTPIRVPVVIPVGHIPGYDVGVDYHSYGVDFHSTAFITRYQDPAVRQTVRTQLQGMADRGATVISTRIWFVTEPGTTNFGDTWRATFPMSDQEKANLRAFAQDVAAIVGAGGNRLRLDLCLLWLGAADYIRGTLAAGLGWTPLAPTEFTRRVAATTDKVLAAVAGVKRPDGALVVDTIYLDGEVMIGDKANQEWFLTTHYPRFVTRVSAAGFRPSVYFATGGPQGNVLDDDYVDVDYPILNNHRSMYSIYRSLRFMADHGLPLPQRVDFSYYVSSSGASQAALLSRVLDDADATLPSLGLPKKYGLAETYYYVDATPRREIGQAIAAQAAADPRLQRVTFWTPGWGPTGSDLGYPYAIEDYYPPPS